MGFEENICSRGLVATHNQNPELALNWYVTASLTICPSGDRNSLGLLISVANRCMKSRILEHQGDPEHHAPVSSAFANSTAATLKAQDAIYDHAFMQLAEEPTVNHKMVLVVRKDLNMSVGKVAAQCSHAAIAIYKRLMAGNPNLLSDWEREGQKKVVLYCNSEAELNELEKKAVSISVPCQTIRDAGRTEIAPGSKTLLVVLGPDYIVDQVTGGLHLLH